MGLKKAAFWRPFTAVIMMHVFWDLTPCGLTGTTRCNIPEDIPQRLALFSRLNYVDSTLRRVHNSGRMASSGMLRREALVRTDVSEERSASFIRVTRIGELGTTLGVTSNRCTPRKNSTSLQCASVASYS
jgi:hypothetical protein